MEEPSAAPHVEFHLQDVGQKGCAPLSFRRKLFMGLSTMMVMSVVAVAFVWIFVVDGGSKDHASAGVDQYVLTASFINASFFGLSFRLMVYNGVFPGPALETRPGNKLEVLLINDLGPNRLWPGSFGGCWPPPNATIPLNLDPRNYSNNPSNFHTTNLHTHGLHVPITGSSDNAFIRVEPRQRFQYSFDIPRNHHSGLFWIHPHVHGSVDAQVSSGLFAPLTVRGSFDDALIGFPEHTFLVSHLKAYRSTVDSSFLDFDPLPFVCPEDGGYPGSAVEPDAFVIMVNERAVAISRNGTKKFESNRTAVPEVTLQQGAFVRVRILVVSDIESQLFFNITAGLAEVYLIAVDGIPLTQPILLQEQRSLLFSRADPFLFGLRVGSGNRIEVLVKSLVSENAVFSLLERSFERKDIVLVNFQVIGNATSTSGQGSRILPPSLPGPSTSYSSMPEPATNRTFVLSAAGHGEHGMNSSSGSSMIMANALSLTGSVFRINGKEFNESSIDAVVNLGTVEQWTFVNEDSMIHPMHIHGNPFLVTSVVDNADGRQMLLRPYWSDTVQVPANYSISVRIAFTDFPGITVYHCHILGHEDLGLMGVVQISGNQAADPGRHDDH